MTEKWRHCLDKEGGISGALLTDLSKPFDCLLHYLLITQLAVYGFDYDSLVFIQSYLSERQQRTKVNNAYSTYSDVLYDVPQGSILLSAIKVWSVKCAKQFFFENLIFQMKLTTLICKV